MLAVFGDRLPHLRGFDDIDGMVGRISTKCPISKSVIRCLISPVTRAKRVDVKTLTSGRTRRNPTSVRDGGCDWAPPVL